MNEFKNRLQMDAMQQEDLFKSKIKFDNTDFLIYDYFEFKGIKYYYIIEDKSDEFKSEKDLTKFFEGNKKIRIEFIFETDKENHIYMTVTDKKLLEELNMFEGMRILQGKI